MINYKKYYNIVGRIVNRFICMNFKSNLKSDSNLLYIFKYLIKLDIENPIIRINTAFKGCSSLEKISVLPRIYHN